MKGQFANRNCYIMAMVVENGQLHRPVKVPKICGRFQ